MLTADKADWSYLAAMFDGEGTFSIAYARGKRADGKPYESTAYRVEVCNTNLNLMDWLIKSFGGVYYAHRRASLQHKIAYYWRPKGRANAERLLLGILPYLKLKNRQANILLQYVRLSHNTQPDAELKDIRRKMLLECQLLNKRGLSVTTNTLNSDESLMIESDLMGDHESDPDVNQEPMQGLNPKQ
jgi:hypothetical protein